MIYGRVSVSLLTNYIPLQAQKSLSLGHINLIISVLSYCPQSFDVGRGFYF